MLVLNTAIPPVTGTPVVFGLHLAHHNYLIPLK